MEAAMRHPALALAGAVGLATVLCLAHRAEADLVVSSSLSDAVLRYTEATGFFRGALATFDEVGVDQPMGLAIGPDGLLYVASRNNHTIYRGNAALGFEEFAVLFPEEAQGPAGIAFGPDGLLYAATLSNRIIRFDEDGIPEVFVPATAGLNEPRGIAFGPDGHLYVANLFGNNVLRFHGVTGAALGAFVAAGSGGLQGPMGVTFGPDGGLYLTSFFTNSVLHYSGSTGAFLTVFVPAGGGGLSGPMGLAFGPGGHLYVASFGTNSVLRYQATGAFLGALVPAGHEGLSGPTFLAFLPAQRFLCYKAQRARGGPVFERQEELFLDDELDSLIADATKSTTLCSPASRDGAPVVEPDSHLQGYAIALTRDSDRPTRIEGLVVENEFGVQTFDLTRPNRLLTLTGVRAGDLADFPFSDVVNDHLCRQAKVSAGTPRFAPVRGIPLVDGFQQPRLYDVLAPTRVCPPVDGLNGILVPETYLTCYKVSPARGQARHASVHDINTSNTFFLDEIVDTVAEEELCVETIVRP
jgi:glucose/arabinose dehydrogenase